ncbi:uncharacterized protein LOC122074585 [Macadamia integrifolia]|uniref:uncharacterized protein LOC122074585 n=1 Tax=Macadamia integrifolia TaxID=60698 RepID=UPI001C4F1454|nr:uncharacterized protein LOC122074585 [Macadamia integrifolia]
MEDKRRKSYQAFLNIFYPPRANQSQRQEEEEAAAEEQAVLNPALTSAVPHDVCDFPEEEGAEEDENSSSESASERTLRNLTRSKRKRLRRMKLKQAASSRRRSIIGPMLPSMEETPHGVDNALDESPITPPPLPETVIHNANAAEGIGAGNRDYRGDPLNVQKKRLKQRRLAKKLSRSTKNCTIKEMEIPVPDMSPAQ